jgi:hypothetical protein
MKRRARIPVSATVVLLTALACGLTASPAEEKYLVLDNGLRVFLVERHNLPLIHIAAAVGAGVKDETDATSGLVHLLEHCVLFRGTERRSGSDVGREIRRVFQRPYGPRLQRFRDIPRVGRRRIRAP